MGEEWAHRPLSFFLPESTEKEVTHHARRNDNWYRSQIVPVSDFVGVNPYGHHRGWDCKFSPSNRSSHLLVRRMQTGNGCCAGCVAKEKRRSASWEVFWKVL